MSPGTALGLVPPLAVLALVVVVLAYVGLLAVVLVRTRPPRLHPTPGPVGAQPPAEVDFLTGGARLQPEAASATLLDLAARHIVDIEEIGPALSLVRLRAEPADAGLTAYERLVWQRVALLAKDGAVATGALAEASASQARWWASFGQAVLEQSRADGFSRARFSVATRALLAGVALVSAGAAGLLGWAITRAVEGASPQPAPMALAIPIAAVAYWLAMAAWRRYDIEVLTPAGAVVAGRWLTTRANLAADTHWRTQPAAAVTIWGRPLAYAAALGLARMAVDNLPVAKPADASHAWSDYSGLWRQVNVRYARGWTWLTQGPPLTVAGRGLLAAGLTGFWIWVILLVVPRLTPDLASPGWARPGGLAAGIVVALVTTGRALLDRLTPRAITGEIIRRVYQARPTRGGGQGDSEHWLAIDDGQSSTIQASTCADTVWNTTSEGDVVQAVVYRRCRWVKRLTVVKPSRFQAADDPPGQPTADDAPPPQGE